MLGRYTVQKVLGRGGMATVYLARHQQTDRLVALKMLDPEFSRDPAYVERFRREAKAAGRIRSDHVVAIYDLDAEVGGSLVLVMEYLEGQSGQQALKPGRMPLQKALSFGRQMLEGLAAAHEAGVIHRDLKPANLFVEKSTTGTEKLKLLDFGISKLADASQQELTRDGQTLGTVAYMAPEQIRGKASATDPRVDLYSAGVSLFMMLSGKRPIDAEDTVSLLAAVLENPPLTLAQAAGLPFPQPIEAFIAKALEKDPSRRFQTAIEMRDALIEAGQSIGYEQTGPLSIPAAGIQPSGIVARPVSHSPESSQSGGSPYMNPPPGPGSMPMNSGLGFASGPPSYSDPSAQSFAPTFPPPLDAFGSMPPGLAPPPMAYMPPAVPVSEAPVAPKSSRTGIVIGIALVGLLAMGGAGALMLRAMNQAPARTQLSGVQPAIAAQAPIQTPPTQQPVPVAAPEVIGAAPVAQQPTQQPVVAAQAAPAAVEPVAMPNPPAPQAPPVAIEPPPPSVRPTVAASAASPTRTVQAPATAPTHRTHTTGTVPTPFDAPAPRVTQTTAPAVRVRPTTTQTTPTPRVRRPTNAAVVPF
ncbi:MAG: serine/threonine-protein kinase [Deltaproteobacteria bacterium]|nr:serine/threonine-protein kinase [Deltaproteobacteria bacterium]